MRTSDPLFIKLKSLPRVQPTFENMKKLVEDIAAITEKENEMFDLQRKQLQMSVEEYHKTFTI